MSKPERTVVLKQSGESFNNGNGNGEFWTPEARHNIAQSIAEAFRNRRKLGISGITVVPGAGNIARGRSLSDQNIQHPDLYGRMFMFPNAAMLAFDLIQLGIDVEPMAAHGMGFQDRHIKFSAYNNQKVLDEHKAGKVVIVAGGTGEDKKTSDYAAVWIAKELKQLYPGDVVIEKSTKYDGVFEEDPAKSNGSSNRQYRFISAADMRANYEQFSAVDEPGLRLLEGQDLSLHVYGGKLHSLSEVLASEAGDYTQTTIGTMVVGQTCKPDFYN